MEKLSVKALTTKNPLADADQVEDALEVLAALRKQGRAVGGYRLDHPFGSFPELPAAQDDRRPEGIQTE